MGLVERAIRCPEPQDPGPNGGRAGSWPPEPEPVGAIPVRSGRWRFRRVLGSWTRAGNPFRSPSAGRSRKHACLGGKALRRHLERRRRKRRNSAGARFRLPGVAGHPRPRPRGIPPPCALGERQPGRLPLRDPRVRHRTAQGLCAHAVLGHPRGPVPGLRPDRQAGAMGRSRPVHLPVRPHCRTVGARGPGRPGCAPAGKRRVVPFRKARRPDRSPCRCPCPGSRAWKAGPAWWRSPPRAGR